MKRIAWAFLIFWLIWSLVWLMLSRWSAERASPVLWYADPNFAYLVPVRWSGAIAASETPQGKANTIVALLRDRVPQGLASPVACVDGIEEFGLGERTGRFRLVLKPGLGSAAERLAVGALVRTFSGLYTAIQGWEVSLRSAHSKVFESQHLDLSQPLRTRDFENQVNGGGSGLTARLWLRVPNTHFLLPCLVSLRGESGSPVRDALAMLSSVSAWAPGTVDSPVPDGMRITWLDMASGVVTLSIFTEANVPSDAQQLAWVACVNTLLAIPGVSGVDLRFESRGSLPGLPFSWRMPIKGQPDSPDGYILPVGSGTW